MTADHGTDRRAVARCLNLLHAGAERRRCVGAALAEAAVAASSWQSVAVVGGCALCAVSRGAVVALLAGLVVFGRDGKMATYGAMVLALRRWHCGGPASCRR